MDKNTLVGFILIGAVLVGFSMLSKPSQEQVAQMKHQQDSIQATAVQEAAKNAEAKETITAVPDSNANLNVQASDSTGLFFGSQRGEETFTTIENDVVKLAFSNKGGRVYSATLKDYNGQSKEPLVLFDGKDVDLNFFFYNKTEEIQSKNLYFQPTNITDSTLTMRLATDSVSHIDFVYTLHQGSYLVDFDIQAVGMEKKLSSNANYVDIEWEQKARQLEKGFTFEQRYSSLTYKLEGDDTDYLSETKEIEESVPGRLDWIAFKNQFFSCVFIANQNFEMNVLKSVPQKQGSGYLKDYSAKMRTFFDPSGKESTTMQFYFGPNKYKTLVAIDDARADGDKLELDQLVPLGWSFLRWINKWFTINLFDWLSGWGLSMGIVLLLMTIIVKLIIFPFTYKSYMSSTRMRVLKPQIDIIGKKYPKKEDAMKKQQETMALYSKYGVSPMSGCLPMLLQMPILIALFMFVPTAIELRQQSFLWAPDLSTYDALISWHTTIPFI
ncbi:MAG: membrane protein insertase YidC, partial [Bacteroides sp.]